MIWEVFRQSKPGGYHTHCGNVHAPNRDLAELFAVVQHGRRMTTNSLWVVPKDAVSAVETGETTFGGTTDKGYRWATTYAEIDASFSDEIAASEREQAAVRGEQEGEP